MLMASRCFHYSHHHIFDLIMVSIYSSFGAIPCAVGLALFFLAFPIMQPHVLPHAIVLPFMLNYIHFNRRSLCQLV
ncbi:hypothetical protein EDD37DRAFT_638288 [Exophiala viscosa]|uniref:uncharacterized protein n=1 Tax=Exophiala viscosa TaxID=2486360 RepID=UPI0021976365|nr:hypothetical protein EDD37DRAFT_638288 [Exophiala viscosa]